MHANRQQHVGAMLRAVQTPAERLTACVAAIDDMTSLQPHPECNPPFWDVQKHQDIISLHNRADIEAIRSTAQMFPATFAAWRTHCHNLEAQNAARLSVLVWVLQQLYAMRDDLELQDQAGGMYGKVVETIERYWRIPATEIPILGRYREWCTKVTRNVRMLPNAWRYV